MTYVVTDNCIKCKYMDCVEVCPVDCRLARVFLWPCLRFRTQGACAGQSMGSRRHDVGMDAALAGTLPQF